MEGGLKKEIQRLRLTLGTLVTGPESNSEQHLCCPSIKLVLLGAGSMKKTFHCLPRPTNYRAGGIF